MKVFITASNQWAGLFWKEHLQRAGHSVTSTWHNQPFSKIDHLVNFDITEESFRQIKDSDVLLLVADPDMVPGGKFVDAGYALGAGKKVILIGRRENLKMHSRQVIAVDTPDDVTRVLIDFA